MADEVLKKIDPMKKPSKSSAQNESVQQTGRITLPVGLKREAWKKDGGVCSYVDEKGEKCGSQHFLEVDHVWPVALGGENRIREPSAYFVVRTISGRRFGYLKKRLRKALRSFALPPKRRE